MNRSLLAVAVLGAAAVTVPNRLNTGAFVAAGADMDVADEGLKLNPPDPEPTTLADVVTVFGAKLLALVM